MNHVFDQRTQVVLGVVQATNDNGQAQTATVQTHDSATRTQVEVHQPYGFASNPPGDGGVAVMLAVGADPGQFVALPLGCPSARFGALGAGESALYAYDGSRVHIRQGGTIEIWGGNLVKIMTPGVTIEATASVAVTAPAIGLTGSVTISGPLDVTGNITCGGAINATGTIHGA